jgi:uncharacterized RDD family membrane protein YckC
MSARVERSVAATPKRINRTEEIVVNFDAAKVKAPFLLRCGALLIDYIVLVSLPVLGLLTAQFSTGDAGTKLFKSPLNSAGWLIAVLLAVTNFIILPMLSGQSLGKIFTGLRIIRTDGRTAKFNQLLIRHLIGYPLTFLTGGLGFLLSVFSPKGRALHDFLAGTIVVYGQKKPKVIAAGTVEKKDYDTRRLDENAIREKA